MRFQTKLVPGRLERRWMRFLSEVTLETGETVRAHCPNPGAMTGLKDAGLRVWLERNDDPSKKLDYGWRLVELPEGGMACIDTSVANRVVGEALAAGAVPGLEGAVRAEVAYGTGSRVDFVVEGEGRAFVEVKSVTLRRTGELAEFPDTVTARGARHLRELAEVARGGDRAVLLYLVQRTDCARVGVAADIDPAYATAFEEARAAGVEVMAHGAVIGPEGITLGPALPVL